MSGSILTAVLSGLPPIVQVAAGAMIPPQAKAELDAVLTDLVTDVANRRDIQACSKLRALLAGVGVDLTPYVENDSAQNFDQS